MKIRTDFVTNSSSSSFIIGQKDISVKDVEHFIKKCVKEYIKSRDRDIKDNKEKLSPQEKKMWLNYKFKALINSHDYVVIDTSTASKDYINSLFNNVCWDGNAPVDCKLEKIMYNENIDENTSMSDLFDKIGMDGNETCDLAHERYLSIYESSDKCCERCKKCTDLQNLMDKVHYDGETCTTYTDWAKSGHIFVITSENELPYEVLAKIQANYNVNIAHLG